MSIYAETASEVSTVLEELGQTGQIVKSTTTGGGPSNTSASTKTTTPTDARMAVFPIATRRIDGANIKAGDFQVIVEALDISIEADDEVICSEGPLKVIHPGKIAPAGTCVGYDMVCRG